MLEVFPGTSFISNCPPITDMEFSFASATHFVTSATPPSVKEPNLPKSSERDLPHHPVVTYALVAACTIIFLVMLGFHLSHRQLGSEPLLLQSGANFGPLTVSGQWWRLISSIFLHLSVLHLAVNMWCLWDLGSFAEGIYGRYLFLAIYLITGVSGAMFSLAWRPFAVEVGASGAIFGMAGVIIASFLFNDLPFPRRAAKTALLSVIAFAGYNLFAGLAGNGAGNAAHIGGFLSGCLIGWLLSRTSWPNALFAELLLIVLGCVVLARTEAYVIPAEQGRTALNRGQADNAIAALHDTIRMKPNFAEGYSLLGQAYMQKQQFPAAEAAYRHSLSVQPNDRRVQYELGVALIAQHRANEAMQIFTQLAAKDKKNPTVQTGIGTAAEMLGDYQRAMEAFRRAAELDPRNAEAYSRLGLAALQVRQFDEAIAAFSNAVRLQPNSANFLFNLAVAYDAKGMKKEAQQAYQRALELTRGQPKK